MMGMPKNDDSWKPCLNGDPFLKWFLFKRCNSWICSYSLSNFGIFYILIRCYGRFLYSLLFNAFKLYDILKQYKCFPKFNWAYSRCCSYCSFRTVSFSRGFYLIRIFRSRYVLRCWNSFLRKCLILWLNNNINLRTSLSNDCNKIPTPGLYYSRGISSFLSVYIPSKCNFYFNIPPVCTTYLCFL